MDENKVRKIEEDLATGVSDAEIAHKHEVGLTTVGRIRRAVQRRQAAGPGVAPAGLSPEEWVRWVRDSPNVNWETRRAAGLALYKSEGKEEKEEWEPPSDPQVWAEDLVEMIKAQPPDVQKLVQESLGLQPSPDHGEGQQGDQEGE